MRHRTGARAPVQTWREAKLNGPLPRLVSSESKPLGRAEERGGAPDVAKPNLSLNSGDLTSRASRSVPNACTAALNEVRESSLCFFHFFASSCFPLTPARPAAAAATAPRGSSSFGSAPADWRAHTDHLSSRAYYTCGEAHQAARIVLPRMVHTTPAVSARSHEYLPPHGAHVTAVRWSGRDSKLT